MIQTVHQSQPENNTAHRFLAPKGGWGWLVLPIVLMFLGSYTVWAIFMIRLHDPALAGQESLAIAPLFWSILQVMLFIIAFTQLRRYGISMKEMIGVSKERALLDVAYGLGLAIVSSAIIAIVQGYLGFAFLGKMAKQTSNHPPFYRWALVYWTTIGAITAGVGEEFYFRGFLMARLNKMKPVWLVIITSLAFAFWHLSPFMLLHTFVIGIIFATVYLHTKRLFPVILAHILTNVIGGIFMMSS
ncbi:MAG: CPBP family intramembrane metalloprotease [candidate division KSB1 bacterium]|nr:CPBP family intramembrane metalloprotease [candidate division KSB1 bacterium]MDZ7356906.1 CPBP family intramembrane metalloprotease [candidate division KSB1 bacterium]MDZ7399263.1 CPBP family intramembrane metalloprotease [candidate division KSB1 bacterium]